MVCHYNSSVFTIRVDRQKFLQNQSITRRGLFESITSAMRKNQTCSSCVKLLLGRKPKRAPTSQFISMGMMLKRCVYNLCILAHHEARQNHDLPLHLKSEGSYFVAQPKQCPLLCLIPMLAEEAEELGSPKYDASCLPRAESMRTEWAMAWKDLFASWPYTTATACSCLLMIDAVTLLMRLEQAMAGM
jgi:hypothetical protein